MTSQEASQSNMIEMNYDWIKKEPVLDFKETISIDLNAADDMNDSDVEILGVLKRSPRRIESSPKHFESQTIRKRKQWKEDRLKTPFYLHTKTIPLSRLKFNKYCKKVNYFKSNKRPWNGFDYANIYTPSESDITNHKLNEKLYNAYLNYDLDYIKQNNSDLFNHIQSLI